MLIQTSQEDAVALDVPLSPPSTINGEVRDQAPNDVLHLQWATDYDALAGIIGHGYPILVIEPELLPRGDHDCPSGRAVDRCPFQQNSDSCCSRQEYVVKEEPSCLTER
jgi:hypothetical protein